MRRFRYSLVLAALGAAAAGGAHAAPRAVVELFTSPFCSACPPADELFVKLARQPDLITLVMPTDSWDRPGRKDALAKPAFTERQAGYADVRNEDTLYTPQAMVNGAAPAMGSDAGEIADAIAQTAGVISVPVKATTTAGEIVVSVGAAKGAVAGGAMVTVLPFVARRDFKVGGEHITYANLVRSGDGAASRSAPRCRCRTMRNTTASSCCYRPAPRTGRGPSSVRRASPCAPRASPTAPSSTVIPS
jgi:hypothetical protein